ncbi:P-loop containing nucleoside triphosphate hydrolase protein [Geopyxis carbonaria]|nr:P-loop containing nucleoside triphosphate hydrolase protein [Geopyxis carbonaria]
MATTVNEVKIVARIRPLLPNEHEKDIVVVSEGSSITIPNPKNPNETFTFPFHAVHGMEADQTQVFQEVSPTLKHLFKGNDVTIFAHGVTGSGKTYTMKGNKPATDRGIIPRLLTAIYRRGKDMEKKSEGDITMSAIMSYYEIYNDRVFDLFEEPSKRTLAGLPVREANGKTHVVGLAEKEISTLKEFETLYDKANNNRSTSATKLNAHSSRSHAVMCVRVEIVNHSSGETRTGTVSCIDLAGSEDNRRTANDKERMVESASINKSLFVLAQCVEAMTKKQARIPYRESKMTRILSLGQNNGMTVMFLNLAPTKAYHQDTLSALNFANRAKKIELKNMENPVTFKPTQIPRNQTLSGQASRAFGTSKTANHNVTSNQTSDKKKGLVKPHPRNAPSSQPLRPQGGGIRKPTRPVDPFRARKEKETLDMEDLIEKKVEEALAARALNEASTIQPPAPNMNDEVNKRLELLERKLEKKADARAEGLTYILLAKQHASRGENIAALKMYQLALEYFPDNEKLLKKISDLQLKRKSESVIDTIEGPFIPTKPKSKKAFAVFTDVESMGSPKRRPISAGALEQSPRTRQLLRIINSEDVEAIMKLKGVGKKRAEALAQHVRFLRESNEDDFPAIKDLQDLGLIKGIGAHMVDNMRSGMAA